MATTITSFARVGNGQVEPNQLSAQKTGQIYASLPLDASVEILQNGEFMYYDYKSGKVTAEGIGEPMLVFNEIKLYEDNWRTSYKDFAMYRVGDNYVTSKLETEKYADGSLTTGATISHSGYQAGYRMGGIAPRMLKTNVGDVYTTNMVKTGADYTVGDILEPKLTAHTGVKGTYNTLVLEKTGTSLPSVGKMAWVVAQTYTMPDGQHGLKIQRVQ